MRKPAEIATAFADLEGLRSATSFFLVGIGGAGMSPLAQMLRRRGLAVAGSDSTASEETERLQSLGIDVQIGHSGDLIQRLANSTMAVVLSDAIDLDSSPEVAAARTLSLPLFRRSQLLGYLTSNRKVIAVTGTHGKTTTTGMIAAGLLAAGMDPLIIVGANVPEFGGSVVEGNGAWAVVEACEAYDAFHDLQPEIVVLTNLEPDHLDFHGTWENLLGSVRRFVARVPETGQLVLPTGDPGSELVAKTFAGQIQSTTPASDLRLAAPGEHNRQNAALALAVGEAVGAAAAEFHAGVAAFRGAQRRLQVLLDGEITVVDDYAHHPTEITASLGALRERFPGRRLVVAFQPHLYSRTADNLVGFSNALNAADIVFLTDIYPAREAPIPGISSARIGEQIRKPVKYVPSRYLLPRMVAADVQPRDVVVGMGAGTISEFASAFLQELDRKQRAPKILVAYGGDSAEREVSLLSGHAVYSALLSLGYQVELADLTERLFGRGDLKSLSGPDRPDLVFLAVHGTNQEDGAVQGLLELLHIPYTGSGIQASAVAMDKQATKVALERAGIRVPRGQFLRARSDELSLQPPVVVKPNAQGSTVGLSFVETAEELEIALDRAFAFPGGVLVEEWIRGMEISTPVLVDRALPPVEIAPISGRYDFASKYTPGATEEIVPARLRPEVLAEAQKIALDAHRMLGCTGATRTDAMVRDPEGKAEIFVLEVNTLPGLTGTSLLPNSAAAVGISFPMLCQAIVDDALANAKRRRMGG